MKSAVSLIFALFIMAACQEPKPKEEPVGTIVGDGIFTSEDSLYDINTKYKVELVSGKHTYGGTTDVTFSSPTDNVTSAIYGCNGLHGWDLDQCKQQARKQIRSYISLVAYREHWDQADAKNFSIEVTDLSEKFIYSQKERFEEHEQFYMEPKKMYGQIAIIHLTSEVRPPFLVIVTDGPQRDILKFKLTPIP